MSMKPTGRLGMRRGLVMVSTGAVAAVAMMALSALPAMASNRGLLPLHPRVADAQFAAPVLHQPVNPHNDPTQPPSAVSADSVQGARNPSEISPNLTTSREPAKTTDSALRERDRPASGSMERTGEASAVARGPVSIAVDAPVNSPNEVAAGRRAIAMPQTLSDRDQRSSVSTPASASADPSSPPPFLPFDALIRRTAQAKSLDAALLHAVIATESGYDPQAVSVRGAIGLMQVLPLTGQRFGVRRLEDPAENLRAGASYLRWLLTRFDEDVTLALAAYNAGEGAVLRYGRKVPPFPETQHYVRKVLAGYSRLREGDVGGAVGQAEAVAVSRLIPSDPASDAKAPTSLTPSTPPTPATPPIIRTDDDKAAHAWRLLRGLGALITHSPAAEARRAAGTGASVRRQRTGAGVGTTSVGTVSATEARADMRSK